MIFARSTRALGAAALLFAIILPARAFAGANALTIDLQLAIAGSSDLQWSIETPNDTATYALFGKSGVGLFPGVTWTHIFDNNLVIGLTGQYRDYGGEFQTPGVSSKNAAVRFREYAGIFRFGYADYYARGKWGVRPWDDILPAYPFGNFRAGVIRSDISRASDFSEFGPAWIGFVGLEFGGMHLPTDRLLLVVSGMVDYTFAVTPYTAEYPRQTEKILNNILQFSLGAQFGLISEPPK
ncbi:hypothetical protein K8I61_15420 [bacterium]|nr:hypothetical protein [bacterium]